MDLASLNQKVNTLCRLVGEYMAGEQHTLSGQDIDTKGLHDYVTHVDKNSEKMLVDGLEKLLPGSGFLVEENTVENSGEEYTWVIDPLDGTTNFIHQLPPFSISVDLMKGQKVIMGTVYDVKARECYYAHEGGPAYMNGEEIHVSETKKLDESLLATGFPYNDFSRQEEYLKVLAYFMKNTRGIRRFGSAAIDLAWVASGRFDGFWEYSLKPWDVAAGAFIVQQAGGTVSDFKGGNNFIHGGEIICGNPVIHDEIIEVVKKFF
ncbi:MAG: inositol monophosphatase [Bacteroidetes bacterium]|nr:MAG: inositol monophosphatase [Bacteroidota bacterium]